LAVAQVLDIAPLRSVVAVADCGGFHRAAAALHLTQSAVSQHLRKIEAVVGAPVVERSSPPTTPPSTIWERPTAECWSSPPPSTAPT
jgi:hypothetical protein